MATGVFVTFEFRDDSVAQTKRARGLGVEDWEMRALARR